MTDLLLKLLINLIIFIFIANCKDFKSGKSNQNSSVSTTGNATNTSNLAALNETALKEALEKITSKDKEAFIDKTLADNSLKDLVRNDKFEPTFWQFINANNSNKILSAGLNDANLSTKAKIDLIENIFQNNAGNTKPFHDAVPALIDISKVKSLDLSTGEINDENEKNKVTDKLTKIFALGEKAIDSFYKFLIPTTLNLFNTENSRMTPVVSSTIIDLMIEKNLLNQIVTTEEHVDAMMQIIEKSKYLRKENSSAVLAGNKKLGQKIVDALNEGPLKQNLKSKVNDLPDNYTKASEIYLYTSAASKEFIPKFLSDKKYETLPSEKVKPHDKSIILVREANNRFDTNEIHSLINDTKPSQNILIIRIISNSSTVTGTTDFSKFINIAKKVNGYENANIDIIFVIREFLGSLDQSQLDTAIKKIDDLYKK